MDCLWTIAGDQDHNFFASQFKEEVPMSWRLRVMISLAAIPLLTVGIAAQETDTYAEEYDLYQKAQQETDVSKRVATILEFVQKYQSSQLDPNVAYLYSQYLDTFRQNGQWQQMATASEKYLRHRPTDKTITAAATEAYQKLGQPQKLVQFGTAAYNKAPSAGTAYLVAKAYQSMGDSANFQKWAERTLRHAPNNPEMLIEMVNAAWSRQDLAKAAEYGQRALKNLDKSDDPQLNQAKAFAHRAIGENAYINGDLKSAQRSFTKAVQLDPMVDFAHFRLGYCLWRAGKVDQAIQSFAKATALKGSSSQEARRELYTLVRQRYGSTSEATKIVNAARQELGISQ
jgi:tetratricopeptide (TPR) repeat protein